MLHVRVIDFILRSLQTLKMSQQKNDSRISESLRTIPAVMASLNIAPDTCSTCPLRADSVDLAKPELVSVMAHGRLSPILLDRAAKINARLRSGDLPESRLESSSKFY